jgi:hypothetical protein
LFFVRPAADVEVCVALANAQLQSTHQGEMPKQGPKRPWRLYRNYALDVVGLSFGKVMTK